MFAASFQTSGEAQQRLFVKRIRYDNALQPRFALISVALVLDESGSVVRIDRHTTNRIDLRGSC